MRGQAQRDKNQPESKTTQRPQKRVDPLPLAAGCRLPAGSGGVGVGSGQREGLGLLDPSWRCCGAAGGRVSLGCFTGLFYKRKKIKVSGGGDADFL